MAMDRQGSQRAGRFRIAVLQLPGVNCEHETAKALAAAGLAAEIVRWTRRDLGDYDGFVLPGGFSFQDRVRAGVVAAREPVIEAVVRAAEDGRPVLGICNGAQVLVEAGLVPDLDGEGAIELGLAPNVIPGRQGYYCAWAGVAPTARARASAFGLASDRGEVMPMLVAHGEGRFVTRDPAVEAMMLSGDIVAFRYVAAGGGEAAGFPANPNGSLADAAGVLNTAGNVLALMPHPERASRLRQVGWEVEGAGRWRRSAVGDRSALDGPGPGHAIFESIRLYLERRAEGSARAAAGRAAAAPAAAPARAPAREPASARGARSPAAGRWMKAKRHGPRS
jgi:phosphoribosylformylglycinamidine synthase